jgi:hypothetical protein
MLLLGDDFPHGVSNQEWTSCPGKRDSQTSSQFQQLVPCTPSVVARTTAKGPVRLILTMQEIIQTILIALAF